MQQHPTPLRVLLGALLLATACADDTGTLAETDTDETSSGTGGMTVGMTTAPTTMTTAGMTVGDDSSTGMADTTMGPGDTSTGESTTGEPTTGEPTSTTGEPTSDTGETTGGAICGDDLVEGDEVCDGSDLAGDSCMNQGFDGGMLGCLPDCSDIDTSACADVPACVEENIGSAVGAAVATGTTVGEDDDFDDSCSGMLNAPDRVVAWIAPHAGTFTFDLFGSGYDTALAAFADCSAGSEIACNDDAGGLQSSIALPVQAGEIVVLSITGFNTSAGDWILNITELETGGPCCAAHASPGCDDTECADQVCAADPDCCDPLLGWSQGCADVAVVFCDICNTPDICGNGVLDGMNEECDAPDFGAESCATLGFDGGVLGCSADCSTIDDSGCLDFSGDCCFDNGPGSPGCDDAACVATICANDPFCCDITWDTQCANAALTTCAACADICGNNIIDGTDVCDGPDIGAADCADLGYAFGTPTCLLDCSGVFPLGCADSDCCIDQGPGSPGCDDPTCEADVCAADPFCCDNTWDSQCANGANALCATCFIPDICGNDTIDVVGEVCDGSDTDGETCVSQGFDGGILGCTIDCSALDTSTCTDFAGDCCAAHGSAGCDDVTCTTGVCEADPFCCENTWDNLCAQEAQGLCTVCGGGVGDCCGDTGMVGCTDGECVAIMCGVGGLDPTCCTDTWDATCTNLAAANCDVCAVCGDGIAAGDELCDGADLGGETCASQGAFIGGTLACEAGCQTFDTAGCIANGGGDCCAANGTPGCDDLTCVASVCVFDSSCCDSGWDQECADQAATYCTACGGTPTCAEEILGSATGTPVASGTTVGEDEDIAQSCGGGGAVERMFLWTAPADGTWQISTLGSTYDTVLSLHSDCGAGNELACNDDSGGPQSLLEIDLVTGEAIYIAVSGFSGATGDFDLNITLVP